MEASTFYYPGWRVTVDGAPPRLSVVPVRGTIAFRLPAGEHEVELRFAATPLRRAAGWVSLATALAVIAVAVVSGRGATASPTR